MNYLLGNIYFKDVSELKEIIQQKLATKSSSETIKLLGNNINKHYSGFLSYTNNINIAYFDNNRYSVLTWSRIDNKIELVKQLNLQYLQDTITDAELVYHFFLKYKKKCVDYFIGDWLFILWDNQKKELFIARDHFGHASLYYYYQNDFLIFSTSLRHLIAQKQVPASINEASIYQFEWYHKRNRQTFYKGIYQLPSAYTLTASLRYCKEENYWLPLPTNPIKYHKSIYYIEHFKDIYTRGISDRLSVNGKTGVTLSSGFDSTSVASIANNLLRKQHKKLHSYTWAPHQLDYSSDIMPQRFGDESSLATRFCEAIGSPLPHIVRNTNSSILKYLSISQDLFAQPVKANSGYQIWELFEAAATNNISVMLTGMEGNFTASYKGNMDMFFQRLLKEKNYKQYITNVVKWKKGQNLSWKNSFYTFLFLPFYKSLFGRGFRSKHDLNSELSIFNQDLIANISNQNEDSFLEKTRKEVNHPLSKRYLLVMDYGQNDMLGEYGNYFGPTMRTPTIDKRLIDFCLNIPMEQYINHTGNKLIFRKAMKNMLPNFILNNKKRGYQGGNRVSLHRKEAHQTKLLLTQMEKSPLFQKWINIPKIKMCEKIILNGKTSNKKQVVDIETAMTQIERAISMGLFFLEYEKNN